MCKLKLMLTAWLTAWLRETAPMQESIKEGDYEQLADVLHDSLAQLEWTIGRVMEAILRREVAEVMKKLLALGEMLGTEDIPTSRQSLEATQLKHFVAGKQCGLDIDDVILNFELGYISGIIFEAKTQSVPIKKIIAGLKSTSRPEPITREPSGRDPRAQYNMN